MGKTSMGNHLQIITKITITHTLRPSMSSGKNLSYRNTEFILQIRIAKMLSNMLCITYMLSNKCIRLYVTLFAIAKAWKQPKFLVTGHWLKSSREYCTAILIHNDIYKIYCEAKMTSAVISKVGSMLLFV